MVSKAREDFPEPLTPVRTTNSSLGISTLRFFRLFTFAPRILINFRPVVCSAIYSSVSTAILEKIRQDAVAHMYALSRKTPEISLFLKQSHLFIFIQDLGRAH